MLQVLTSLITISLINARLFGEIHDHAAVLEERVASRTAELQSQKEQTEAILSSVADAVLVFDLDGNLVLANPQAQLLMAGEWSRTGWRLNRHGDCPAGYHAFAGIR
jgi:PAS domain-containing protein